MRDLCEIIEEVFRRRPPGPTAEEKRERARLQKEVDDFRRRHPALAARLDAEMDQEVKR